MRSRTARGKYASSSSGYLLVAYTDRHSVALRKNVTRAAVVRPRGLTGAIANGFFSTVIESPFPVTFWEDADKALENLQCNDPIGGVRALESAQASVGG